MAKDPAFLFYPQDFIVGTYTMTDAQVGQYIRLMCLQHQQGHLPEATVSTVMGGSIDPDVISKFTIDSNGLYYNERLEAEAEKRAKYTQSRRDNRAKAQPVASYDNHMSNISSSCDNHMSNICESHVKHMENENENVNGSISITATLGAKQGKTQKLLHGNASVTKCNTEIEIDTEKEIEPKKKPGEDILGLFNRFWAAYPRKVAKPTALRAFEKAKPDDALLRLMLAAIERDRVSPQWQKDGGQYIPHAATWLNGRRWEDEIPIPPPARERKINILSD